MKKIIFSLLAPMSLAAFDHGECYSYGVNPVTYDSECCQLGVRADFLYWKPHVDNNSFAVAEGIGAVGTFGTDYISEPKEFSYNWNGGFRLGIEAGLPCNEWSGSLDWTHYRSFAKGTVSAATSDHYVHLYHLTEHEPLDFGTTPDFFESDATANWKIELNQIDLVFAREFYVGDSVTLKPFGGLRAMLLRQRLNGSSASTFLSAPTLGFVVNTQNSEVLSSQFKGVGIALGFSSTWALPCHFSLFGDVAASLLYGKTKVKANSTNGINSDLSMSITTYDWKNDVNHVKGVLDLALGLEWRQAFTNSFITLRAGFEEHLYFNQNAFPRIKSVPTGDPEGGRNLNFETQSFGDVSFQGLVISISIDGL